MTSYNSGITIRLSGGEYGNRDYNIPELLEILEKNPIIDVIKKGILANNSKSISDLLSSSNFKNRIFENVYLLAGAIAEEFIKNDTDTGKPIPRIIHNFWTGGEMSENAVENVLKWYEKAKEYDWKHFLWTDSNVNQAFIFNNENESLIKLQTAGVQILDFPQLFREMPEDTQKAYNTLSHRAAFKHKRILPFLSDLARYNILYNQGGVYCDVDVAPGNVNLEKTLKHKDSENEIPLLGPCFRVKRDAKVAGYFENISGGKEAACLRMYNNLMVGNHFIATRPETDIMKQALGYSLKSLNYSNFTNTLGPRDIKTAILAKNIDIKIVSAQTIPPWLFDIDWITDESNNIVI